MRTFFLSAFLFLMVGISHSDQQTYRLKSGDYELSISPRYQQTMRSISYQERMLGTPTGFYNLVIGEASGKYIGAGHTEGGREEVLQFRLVCDDKPLEPQIGKEYSGKKIVLEKESRLLQTIFYTRITMTPEGILEQKRFRTIGPQKFYYLYLFLYCFDKNTTDYAALTADNNLQTGAFDGNFSGSNRWHLSSDVKWAAILDRNSGHGLMLYYPEIIKGSSRKSAFWEVKNAYNKYYLMGKMPALPADFESPLYSVIIKGFNSTAETLSGNAAKIAKQAGKWEVPDISVEVPQKVQAAASQQATVDSSSASEVLFAADYTLSDVSFAAQQAKGSTLAKVILAEKAQIDFDLMSHSNRGLQIGEGRASLLYSAEGNLPLNKGSMEMTFANAWPGDLNEMVVLAQTGPGKALPGQGKFYLYKYKNSGIAAYFEVAASGKKLFLNFPTLDWPIDSWHHLLVTWQDGEAKLYVDGKLRKTGSLDEQISNWPDTFCIGPFSRQLGAVSNSTIANFTTYSKAFSDPEVAALAARRLPNLKIAADNAQQAALAAEDVVLSSSPWFAKQEKIFLEALADDYVPKPWTPLTVEKRSIKVWGREYDFSSTELLQGVACAAGNLLAAPITLQLNGHSLQFSAAEFLVQSTGRTSFRRTARQGGIELELLSTLEYDGMLWNTLIIHRHGKTVEALELNIPISAEFSEFIHYVGAPTAYESQNLIKHSLSKTLPRDPGLVFQSSLRTNVWIGNNQAGLLYFLESDQYFYPHDREDLLTIHRQAGGAAELKIAMVVSALPGNCPEQIQYQFGLQATPVKPLPEGWRAFTFSAQYDSLQASKR
ncbi:MAG: glycoside hydrolase domain-containing protein, partial [Lentisphaeria bacterium]